MGSNSVGTKSKNLYLMRCNAVMVWNAKRALFSGLHGLLEESALTVGGSLALGPMHCLSHLIAAPTEKECGTNNYDFLISI